MIYKTYGKRIIASGLILLLTSSFMYFYNKHPHIERNIIKNPSNNISSSLLYNHNTENRKIFSEINVLKETIIRNNFMFNSYKKIISHNINYQKNTLYKKIKFANLSIGAEIKILNNMENIINIHPFNYLEKFRENNYYLPEISPITNQNKFVPINNINIYKGRIKSTSPDLNSILYSSEEVFVGIKSIDTLISGTRLLIFSKNNFINSNIYCFSKHLNILTTYNKYVNTKNYDNKNQLRSKNKFIKKLKPKIKNIYKYSKSDLSNKNSRHNNNNINKKVYISFSALLLVAGIIIVILGKDKTFNKRKRYNPIKSSSKPSSQKRESVSIDNIETTSVIPSIEMTYLQEHIENNTRDSANSSKKPYNTDGIDYKVDNPDDILDLNSGYLQNVEHMDSELTAADGIMLLHSVREISGTPEVENNTMTDSDKILPKTIPTDTFEPVLFEKSIKRLCTFHPITHTDSQYYDPLVNPLYYQNEKDIFGNDRKITLLNSWLHFREFSHEGFHVSLMKDRVQSRYINNRTFKIQVDSFLHQKKLSSFQGWRRPNSQLIFSNVWKKIEQSNDKTLSDNDKSEALASLRCITQFDSREELNAKGIKLTNNGWFKVPRDYPKKWFTSDNITLDEHTYLKKMNTKFNNMDLLLSDCMSSDDFFKILLDEIDKKTIVAEENSEMTYLDRYIVNEIMLDIREIIKMYKSKMVISHIDTKLLKNSICERITFPKYIEWFENSKVVKTVYDGPRIFGTSENKIFASIEKFTIG